MSSIDNAELLAQVTSLSKRVEQLEAALAFNNKRRKHAKIKIALGLAALMIFPTGAAVAHLADSSGANLLQFMDSSTPHASVPPLDTLARWSRRDPAGVSAGYTNELLSLIAEASQKNSYTWPLYVQVNGTNHPGADMNTSQSVGATVRAYNRSTGSPWLAGFHSEIYHGRDGITGSNINANGTSILYNAELTNLTSAGTKIGLNIQNTVASTAPGTHAINIQSGSTTSTWLNGIHFEGSKTAGNIGINFDEAQYNMGIELANNSIRMNAGQKLILERYGTVYIWYNPASGQVEVVKGGTVVASW